MGAQPWRLLYNPQRMRIATILFLALLTPGALSAQHGVAGLKNPYARPGDVAIGADLYRGRCAVCHGASAIGGDRGPELASGRYKRAVSDEDLFNVITNGVPGTDMPAFAISGEDVWRMVAYLRSLAAEAAVEQATGDAATGRELFHGKAGCTGCHAVEGAGSRMGPNLSGIGGDRSIGQLEDSILHPERAVLAENWFVSARTSSGETVSGRRLNEDSFSVQIIDTDGNLRGLDKTELQDYQVIQDSRMPSFEGRLSSTDVENLVAYLVSLR